MILIRNNKNQIKIKAINYFNYISKKFKLFSINKKLLSIYFYDFMEFYLNRNIGHIGNIAGRRQVCLKLFERYCPYLHLYEVPTSFAPHTYIRCHWHNTCYLLMFFLNIALLLMLYSNSADTGAFLLLVQFIVRIFKLPPSFWSNLVKSDLNYFCCSITKFSEIKKISKNRQQPNINLKLF